MDPEDLEYHTIRDSIHSHPKVLAMLEHVTSDDGYRIYFSKMMGNNVSLLDTPVFRCVTHRMLVGGLVMVWSKAFQDGKQSLTASDDIILVDAGREFIDALSGVPGTFNALKAVDWLVEEWDLDGKCVLRFPRLGKYI